MDITCIVFGTVFCIAGFLLAIGKLHNYIAAWKNTPEEEKEKIKIKELCRNIGSVIFLSGIVFLINGFSPYFREHWFVGTMIAWLVFAGIDLLFIFKSKHYEVKK